MMMYKRRRPQRSSGCASTGARRPAMPNGSPVQVRATSAGSELSRQIPVDLEADADLNERRGAPGHWSSSLAFMNEYVKSERAGAQSRKSLQFTRDPAARAGRRIRLQTRPASAAGLAAPGRAVSWSRSSGRRRRRRHTETLKMGSSARGAERGEIVTLHNKTLSARLSPISQDGFPLRPLANARVCKCGGVRG